MRCGIITHYDVHNHGALLQLNGLIKVLGKIGYKAQALQFEKNYDFMGIALKNKYNIGIRSIPIYIKYLLHNGFSKTWYNYKKRQVLEKFKKQEELIGSYYTECDKLPFVIIGSDEVFALHTGITPAFFGHALPTENVFSYAGSFGPTKTEEVKERYCEAIISSGLKAMRGISVRDVNSRNVVRDLTGILPELVCDPVLLYGYKHEITLLEKPQLPPYLLVYAYDNRMNDKEEVEAVKAYARAHNMKTVSPGFYHSWCDYNVNVDPVELLAYFKYANHIVTDTFHGSVMSIITNAPFMVKTRESNYNKLFSLLDEYHLADRIFKEFDAMEDVSAKGIDWDNVNEVVEKRREESMAYLNRMIEICK